MEIVKFDLYWRKPENRKYFDEFYQIKRDAPEKVKKSYFHYQRLIEEEKQKILNRIHISVYSMNE